jgi:hypothetical protein
MLFKILKLFGLDVPAKLEAAKTNLELRVERAAGQIRQVAREAAVIAVLSALATIICAMAFGVGLIALYRVTADAYGDYAALGVVGGILVAAAAIVATVAMIKARSLGPSGVLPRHGAGKAEAALGSTVPDISKGEVDATALHASSYSRTAAKPEVIPAASASDLVEPLAFFLSRYVKFPVVGNPTVDELIGNLRATAHGSADEAVDRAVNVIRHGSRANLFFVLTGTAFLAWLVTHNSQRYS